jgi:glycosyltransferase involved in cell wall biosynthesis
VARSRSVAADNHVSDLTAGSAGVRKTCVGSRSQSPDRAIEARRESLRIAILAPLVTPVPPPAYAGTERVIAALASGLHQRGHRVTLYASGDSEVPYDLVPVLAESLWAKGFHGDGRQFVPLVLAAAWRDAHRFDVLHSHLDSGGFVFARHGPRPVVTTLHNRLDTEGMPQLLDEFTDVPLVAISESQRRWTPDANWVATIHHGIASPDTPFGDKAGDYLALVGRMTWEKGVEEAIEVARRVRMPLKIAGKAHEEAEMDVVDRIVQPAIRDGVAEFVGELPPNERDALVAGARACLMLGAWPEPFGLVAIESMVTGTPVIARRAGALIETIRHGETGFLVDDLTEAEAAVQRVGNLDRAAIREYALETFSPELMVDRYEAVYAKVAAQHAAAGS